MPVYTDESTWPRYALTVDVPDVKCERCVIQMASLVSSTATAGKWIDWCVSRLTDSTSTSTSLAR